MTMTNDEKLRLGSSDEGGGKAMTNYEVMRLMDKDELVEFLLSSMEGGVIRTMDKDERTEFLSSIVDCGAIRIMDKDELAKFMAIIMACKKCPASEKFCDGKRECDDAILNWLNAELDDVLKGKRLISAMRML